MDEAQHCRVERLVILRQRIVLAIRDQYVLDEIIRPETEKIDLLGERRGHHRCRGDLDHGADRDSRIEILALGGQLVRYLLHEHTGRSHLLESAYDGEQNGNRVLGAEA